MKRKIALLAFGLVLAGQTAFAITSDSVISDLQAEGYTRVEVRVGPTQMKVEAIRGTEKLEMIILTETGQVLKTETEVVGSGENTTPGVSVRDRNRDFVRVVRRSGSDDDNGGDRNRGHGDDDDRVDDDNPGHSSGHGRGRGRDDDDDSDDDRDDDRGSDDSGSDDHGGDRDRSSDDD